MRRAFLNPIRAGITQTLEESDFTAVQQRLGYTPEPEAEPEPEQEKQEYAAGGTGEVAEAEGLSLPLAPLMPFDATGRTPQAIPYAWDEYLELMDWLGRAAHLAKRGRIPAGAPRFLDRLGVDAEGLAEQADSFLRRFGAALVPPNPSPTPAPAANRRICAASAWRSGCSAGKRRRKG